MSKQVLEHSIHVAKLACRQLAERTNEAIQSSGNELGLKFAESHNIGNPSFTVSSNTLTLEVSPKLDGSIAYYWRGITCPDAGRFEVIADDSGIHLIQGDENLSVEEVRDQVLLRPFSSRPVNKSDK